MSKYKVGETLWHGYCSYITVDKPCPVCFGKKKVILILGNDAQVTLSCDMCEKGYEAPRGFISVYEYSVKPQLVTIDRISTERYENSEDSTYYSGSYVYYEDQLFTDKEDAEVFGLKEKERLEKEQFERLDLLKWNAAKSFAWNAGYHMREAKKHREDAEFHEKKAVICKSRSKGEKNENIL